MSSPTPTTHEWITWGTVVVASFAYLEWRAFYSDDRHGTLSHAIRKVVKRQPKLAFWIMTGAFSWFAWHVIIDGDLPPGGELQ